MLHILLVRPGATEFDEQGRIKGSLDMPLSESGRRQAAITADQLCQYDFDVIYSGPSESTQSTASAIARACGTKVKVLKELRNVDHGLWHGKLIDEVRRQQPKVFRQGQEIARSLCPPGGESVDQAQHRARSALLKLLRKNRSGLIALVVPEPMASVVRSLLDGEELKNLWNAERDAGDWELIEIEQPALAN